MFLSERTVLLKGFLIKIVLISSDPNSNSSTNVICTEGLGSED